MGWNLRDRLQHAEEQRRLAAGLPAAELAPPEPPSFKHRETPPVIDLTDPAHVLTYSPAPTPTPPIPNPAFPAAASPASPFAHAGGGRATLPLPSRDAGIGLPVWQGSSNHPVTAASPPSAPTGRSAATGAEAKAFDVDGLHRTIDAAPVPSGPVVASKAPVKDRCPSCQGKVRLDRFDLDHAVANMSCTECGFTYTAKSPKL